MIRRDNAFDAVLEHGNVEGIAIETGRKNVDYDDCTTITATTHVTLTTEHLALCVRRFSLSQPIQICIALTGEVQEQGFQSMELITVELDRSGAPQDGDIALPH